MSGIIYTDTNSACQQAVSFSVFQNVYNTTPIDTAKDWPLDDFIWALHEWHQRTVANKESNAMLCPAVFRPDTDRAVENVIKADCGLWLDNDTGHFNPQQFAELFPGLRFVAFNTFSTTIDRPKYRLFIPTDHSTDADCYSAAVHEFIRHVVEADPEHGFDLAPTHAAALFYLPCQAASGYSFFTVQPGDILGIESLLIGSAYVRAAHDTSAQARSSVDDPPADLIQALEKIPADDYEIWRKVCCALSNSFGESGFTLFDCWSQRSAKYNPHHVRKKWENIAKSGHGRRITLGTIYYLAKQYS
jgi:hypothetical protein